MTAPDVATLIKWIRAYDVAEWPTAANLLADYYQALRKDHLSQYVRVNELECDLAQERFKYGQLLAEQRETDRLRKIESRLDTVLAGKRFTSWINYRVAFWIKNGTFV